VLKKEVNTNNTIVNINSNDPLCISKFFQGTGFSDHKYFNGIIDDIRIYNKALNKKDILNLFFENDDFTTIPISNWAICITCVLIILVIILKYYK